MTGTTAQRHAAGCPDGPGGSVPPAPPRHFSYATGQWSVRLDYAGLTALMDMVFGLWDHLEDTGTMDNPAGDMFECILGRIAALREYTGWDGVPEKYLR